MTTRVKAVVGLMLALAALSVTGLAAAESIQEKGIRVAVSGELSPQSLPRRGSAPIAVSVGGKIKTARPDVPTPTLKTLEIELNRNGKIDASGLPVCKYNLIQPASTKRALAACRSALVGTGSFSAEITLAGQQPYPTKGKLLAFNGRVKGKPVLYGQIYAPRPFATSFVIVFQIQKAKGKFGTALSATLPETLRSWGNLTGIELRLKRIYHSRGKRRSYISAGCHLPPGVSRASFPFARTSFGFQAGPTLSTTLSRSCRAHG